MNGQSNSIDNLKKAHSNYQNKLSNKSKKKVAFERAADPAKRGKAEGEMKQAETDFNNEHLKFTKELKQFQSDRVSIFKVN